MNRNFDVPMPRMLGIRIMCKIGGREKEITLKVVECDVPLPITSEQGVPTIRGLIYTTGGEITMDSKPIPQPDLAMGIFKSWVVEDMLYDALGRDKPKEELNPEIVGPTSRKIAKLDDDDKAA